MVLWHGISDGKGKAYSLHDWKVIGVIANIAHLR